MSAIQDLLVALKKDKATPNKGVPVNQIHHFQEQYGVYLPYDMREYFQIMNGMSSDELFGLARLWPLENLRRVTDYFWQSGNYKSDVLERLDVNVTIDHLNIYRLVMLDDQEIAFLLPNAQEYFIFADYNIEGSHWAIRLNDSSTPHTVVLISAHVNIYREVARSFYEFLEQFAHSPEDLL